MVQTLLVLLALSGFVQKWYFPQGTNYSAGRICVGDADRDGSYEFYIRTYGGSQKVYIYELHLPNTWEVDSFPYFWGPLVWDLGDFDLDGVYDLVIQTAVDTPPRNLISIAESPDSFSYPTSEVWRDTVGFALVTPTCAYDIDRDGLPELVKIIGDTTDFDVYESTSNDTYAKIFQDTTQANHSPMSTIAFGDFNLDGNNEFVFGYSGGEYSIWECIGDNNYQEITFQQLSTLNIKDCFAVPDADQDGKWEFVVKGFVIPTAEIHAFIFESIADNTYEVIHTFTLPGGDYYGGYSEAGDVDGDSVPEIVLEARQNVFIIKAAGNDSFYVWDTLPGHGSGSCVRVYDIDDNGLAEIVISGEDETRIYEYDGGSVEERREYCVENSEIRISPNPFREKAVITLNIADQSISESVEGISANQQSEIHIYDATGRLVRSLSLPAASTLLPTVIWDGTDNTGRPLGSGVYFVHVETPNTKDVEKVILLR